MKDAPRIDKRNGESVLDELGRIAPYYTPDWDATTQKGPGAALIRCFSAMVGTIIQRLNAVPSKNLVTFLDTLGVKLLPPQPAWAPMTFVLSEGTAEGVLIPERTQTAAEKTVFETKKSFMATPSALAAVYSTLGDKIFEAPKNIVTGATATPFNSRLACPAGNNDRHVFQETTEGLAEGDIVRIGNTADYTVVAKITDSLVTLTSTLSSSIAKGACVEKVTAVELSQGKNLQEHILYMGHGDLFKLKKVDGENCHANLTVEMNGWEITDAIKWEYWGANTVDGEGDWLPLAKDNAAYEYPGILPTLEKEINGIRSYWIRCVWTGARVSTPQIDSISISIDISSGPDMCFYNDVPIVLDKVFKPFGDVPKPYDVFYIASWECFSKKGCTILVSLTSPDGGDGVPRYAVHSWEYWDGEGWTNLPNDSSPDTLGNMTFNCPADIEPTKVSGHENYWIRVKLVSGNYGEVTLKEEKKIITVNMSNVNPPKLSSITINVLTEEALPLDACLSYNNLCFIDVTAESRGSGKPFTAFERLDEPLPSLYLGFDKKLEKGPVSVFFDIEDPPSVDETARVRWYYFAEKDGQYRWERLDALDGTSAFFRSGTVEFVFPDDFIKGEKFGKEHFWIRAVCEQGEARQVIKGIYPNTTWSVQAASIGRELLGSSDGEAGQMFSFSKPPIYSSDVWVDELNALPDAERREMVSDKGTETAEVKDEKGDTTEFRVKWTAVDDLIASSESDRHYEFDGNSGVIRFGDGKHGRIPPTGSNNISAEYLTGGGTRGNVGTREISTLKTSIAFVDKVYNPLASGGGSDAEIIEDAIDRVCHHLKNRSRGATAEDYEYIAKEASRELARVKCIPNMGDNKAFEPGWVTIVLIPSSLDEKPLPSLQLKSLVENYMKEHAAGVVASQNQFVVTCPEYVMVSVKAKIFTLNSSAIPSIEKEAMRKIREFLHPLCGGYEGKGWGFGSAPYLSDFYSILEKVTGADHVEDLAVKMYRGGVPVADDGLESHEIVYSGVHSITVTLSERIG